MREVANLSYPSESLPFTTVVTRSGLRESALTSYIGLILKTKDGQNISHNNKILQQLMDMAVSPWLIKSLT